MGIWNYGIFLTMGNARFIASTVLVGQVGPKPHAFSACQLVLFKEESQRARA